MRAEAARRGSGGRTQGMPAWLLPVILLFVGIVLGLVYGWVIDPVTVTGAYPSDLRQDWKQAWVAMTAQSLAINNDEALARQRLSTLLDEQPEELNTMLAGLIAAAPSDVERTQLQRLATLVGTQPPTTEGPTTLPTPATGEAPAEGGSWLSTCLISLLVLGLIAVAAVAFTRMQRGGGASTTTARRPRGGATTGTPKTGATPATQRRAPPALPAEPDEAEDLGGGMAEEDDEFADFTLDLGQDQADEAEAFREIDFGEPTREAPPPVAPTTRPPAPPSQPRPPAAVLDQFVARYNLGDTDYDVNFVIETPKAEFLGECGVAISEALDNGDPQRATALEVWLFDKDDIRTITKVMLSDYASQDEGIRGRLAPKGELVVMREGDVTELETASLRVQIKMREVAYGWEGEYPERSYFERVVLELTPMQKGATGGRR
jgi:hypothetical protein